MMVRFASLAILIVLFPAGELAAQQFVPTGRGTLRGLPGVEVVVEPLPTALEATALTTASVGSDVARQLREAGITTYKSQRENPSVSKPYLYIHINALAIDGGQLAVALQVHVRQTLVSLTTESKIVDAMSWDAHQVIAAPATHVTGAIRAELADLVSRFVEDWRAVH
jgi:hypothetical protein